MSGGVPPSSVAPPPRRPELPEPLAGDREPGPNWQWWMAPAAVVLAFVAAIVAALPVLAIASALGSNVSSTDDGAANIVLTVVQDGAFIGAALFLASTAGPLNPRDFGLRATRVGRAIGWTVLAAVTYYVFAALWSQVAGSHKQDDLFKSLGVSRGAFDVALLVVLVCVVAPIAEEFLFRGFCFGALRPKLGVVGAAVAVGIIFGAIHISSTPAILLPTLGVLGFLLCLLRWRTGSLYPCIALHCVNNAIAFGLLQGWDWQVLPVAAGSLAAIAAILAPVHRRGAVARSRALA